MINSIKYHLDSLCHNHAVYSNMSLRFFFYSDQNLAYKIDNIISTLMIYKVMRIYSTLNFILKYLIGKKIFIMTNVLLEIALFLIALVLNMLYNFNFNQIGLFF